MTPLPPPLGTGEIIGWRLDQAHFKDSWDSGEGSFRVGGRWAGRGIRTVYASLDPATAILEVAVHVGFRVLDTKPHVLSSFRISDPAEIHVVSPDDVPNPHWLRPTIPNAGQQAFGAALLATHTFVLIPSAVSSQSWNLLFEPARAAGRYDLVDQVRFALDPRFNPVPPLP